MRRVRVEPVVPPAALSRERRDRHQLDRGDTELPQRGQVRHDSVEGSLGGERPDVELVDHELFEREAAPDGRRELDDPRRAVIALGLAPGARIRKRPTAVEHIQIVVAGRRAENAGEDAATVGLEHMALALDPHVHGACLRRPDAEPDVPAWIRDRTESVVT
jgi:hypothetical protein